jgi:hypothetical protein
MAPKSDRDVYVARGWAPEGAKWPIRTWLYSNRELANARCQEWAAQGWKVSVVRRRVRVRA